jgi:TonB-linked SusC/RagA family outer membrane protein
MLLENTKKLLFILCLCSCSLAVLAQQGGSKMKGKVVDNAGEPLIGALIEEAGSKRKTTTDIDGFFELDNVKTGSRFLVSYLGMKSYGFQFQGKELSIILEPKAENLSEVTVVAYATQKKESVLASITTIKPSDLKVPSSNLTTALAGRISGLISYQQSGEPGNDNAEFFIRGVTTFGTGKANPLILIDGIELSAKDLARLTPDDIASFSVMKDANATALYGARGANGVILVTTKQGETGKARFSLRIEESLSSPTINVKTADPVTFMKMHNEAESTRNPGSFIYSEEKIAQTGVGNPYVYPATDWRKLMFKDHTNNMRANMNVSGGGKIARYYVAASFSRDNGLARIDKRNSFSNNIRLNNYQLRSNVNINLTKTTEVILRLHGNFEDYSGPLNSGAEAYNDGTDFHCRVIRTNPVLFPPYYAPDAANRYTEHILFGGNDGQNPYADMVKGYKQSSATTVLSQVEVKQNLDAILKGLSLRGMFNINRYSYFDSQRYYGPYYYDLENYDPVTDKYVLFPLNELTGYSYLSYHEGAKNVNSVTYFEGAAQYGNVFAEDHAVSALAVVIARNELKGNAGSLQKSLPYRNLGLSGRLTYAYQSKYFIEGNFGYNGSEKFATKERYGFFPSVGAGYLVSNEKFWESYSRKINKLKLKATYGLVGNDAIGDAEDRFFYLSTVNMDDEWRGSHFGTDFTKYQSGIGIIRYANPYITWETSYKQNYGIELGLYNNFELQLDYFRENRKNILMERADIPSIVGLQAVQVASIGQSSASGIDMSVDYSQQFSKNFFLSVMGNFTYATGKYKVFEEPLYANAPWRSHIGTPLKGIWGLIAERLFTDEEDVANSPVQDFGPYGAGDIKYKDINKDDKIDEQDVLNIGYPSVPEIIYGFGFSMKYRNFDLSSFFQGSAHSSFIIDPNVINPYYGTSGSGALLQAIADDYWSESHPNPNAFWPRLSNNPSYTNNFRTSTWWLRDGSFLRIKNIELGFALPQKLLNKWHIPDARIYVNGSNLYTFTKFKTWDTEMGTRGLNYPVQRVFNVGININL